MGKLFRDKIVDFTRNAVVELDREMEKQFSMSDVYDHLGDLIQNPENKKRVKTALAAMLKSGEIEETWKGKYRLVHRQAAPLERLWRVLRAKKGASSVSDLVELACLSEFKVRNLLKDLVDHGFAREVSGKFILVKDQVDPPDFHVIREAELTLAEEALDLAQRLAAFARRINDARHSGELVPPNPPPVFKGGKS